MVGDLVGSVIIQFILRDIETHTRFNALAYESPYSRVWIFFLGMLVAYYFNFKRQECNETERKTFNRKEIIIAVLFAAYWLGRNRMMLYENGEIWCAILDIIIPAYMIYLFSFSEGIISRWLNQKWIVELSKYSMYFYFIHYPIRMYLLDVNISNVGMIVIILNGTFIISFIARKISVKFDV